MKVIIAGSRNIIDYDLVVEAITKSKFKIGTVVSGHARGVDLLGEKWANLNQIPRDLYPADWDTHGKKAGFLRNAVMADYADALIAVWDGESKGTKDMIDRMCAKKKPVFVFGVRKQRAKPIGLEVFTDL